ncbi:hypothetical protein ABZ345_01905 [Lentzea sp. NPDC005914]|uniref:hypothetical protein n=1 Tax=Lentzea sp. NPDC005914 TaxID=3154572 RepID=UPI0033EB6991
MRRLVLLVLLLVAVASCGNNERDPQVLRTTTPNTTALTTPMNDLALTKAAEVVQPLLEKEFASTYAGLEVHGEMPMMVVHRKPDPRLDAEVRKAAPEVRVEFRDARYTRAEMAEYVKRVMDDTGYWKGRGIQIVEAGPTVDGSGVEVGVVAAPPGNFARQLDAYYPAMSFTLKVS